ncbi:helix-turn-helix transcriptional regulator [Streptomyces lanatus]|uniref:Response regulator transcription factor n=1 Tax=Streptomyces lanatus TaxID=66900 RepID=A0ABV1Y212_9ACTN|nr:response regulator transcription factor [Streptomyces lanatus]
MFTRPDESSLKIALILENEVSRYGVEGMLRRLGSVHSVLSFNTGDEALASCGADAFDLVVVSGAELAATQNLAATEGLSARDVRLLLLVDAADGVDLPQSAHSCVHALVDWAGLTPEVFADAVSDVMAGKFYVSATLARRVLRQTGPAAAEARPWGAPGTMLTPRELEVLHLVAEGLSNKQAARRLQISEHGVKRLVGNVLAKLNCPNRTLAVVRAMEDGLLTGLGRAMATPQSATRVA